jgi:predicted alpha/beta superfamily hydrolase
LLLLSSVIALAGIAPLSAVPYTLSGTDQRELPVSANGRQYLLYIGLPPSYGSQPTRQYPTLYVLDGYWDFSLMMNVTGLLRVDSAAPEVIVVGIGYAGANPDYNALRTIDLTPGADAYIDATGQRCGHADEFLSVIANQIIPFVQREYRADPSYRVLAGTSFAGLFPAYVAMERPTLFNAFVACSPSLWWRNQFLVTRASTFARDRNSPALRLYLSYASEDHTSIVNSTRAFFQQLNARSYPGLSLAIREMEGERHSTTKPETYTRGLRFAFAPLAPQPATIATTIRGQLVNTSSRGRVGAAAEDVVITGFVIDGIKAKRVLVRAGGPALTPLAVADVLTDPYLRVHDSRSSVLAENDNWGGTAELITAAAQTGAYAFASDSRDAAVIVTLAPGAYTAVASGVNGGTGNVLVEVYELP